MLVADANGAQQVRNAISNKYRCLFKYVVLVVLVGPLRFGPGLLAADVAGQHRAWRVRRGLLILQIRRFAASIVGVFVALRGCSSNALEGIVVVVVAVAAPSVDTVAFCSNSCAFDDIDNNVTPDNGPFGVDEGDDVSTATMAFLALIERSFASFVHSMLFIIRK